MSKNQLLQENRQIFGISNTYLKGQIWLSHAEEDLSHFLKDVNSLLILPYALHEMNDYAVKLIGAFKRIGVPNIQSIHNFPGKEKELIESVDAIFIAGGNTGRLLANLHCLKHENGQKLDQRPDASQFSLIETIQKVVSNGVKLIGSSAGLNVMCSDIRTSNDMYIAVQNLANKRKVARLDGIGVFPDSLSINPHYLDKIELCEKERALIPDSLKEKIFTIIDHQGESRNTRILQAIEFDPKRTVLALREGAYIIVEGMNMKLLGKSGGLIFRHNLPPLPIKSGDDISFLLAVNNNEYTL